jgi:transposase
MKQSSKSKSSDTAAVMLVAIDVAAASLVVASKRDGKAEAVATYANTPAGHRGLIKHITSRGASARVILEATGIYSLGLALGLHGAQRVEVMVINPRTSKDYQRACGTRAKTDRVDALGLLDYLERMPFVAWTAPPERVLTLQQLTRRIFQLKAEVVREQARLHAVRFTPDEDQLIKHDLELNLAHLRRRIKALQTSAAKLVAEDNTLQALVARLSTTPGIAQLSAHRLLAELLVLPAHLKAPQWTAHAGLDPRPVESGSSVHKPRRITKTGNRYLRTALFMPALVAIQRCPQIKAYYEALVARGKKRKQAVIAVMRKMLHAIWGMLRHQTNFNADLFYTSNPRNTQTNA